jgi:hypothetical protein
VFTMFLRIHGASVVGASHAKGNIPCQDAFAYKMFPPHSAAISVADGLGTAIKSEIGSQAATQAVVRSVEESLSDYPQNPIDMQLIAKESLLAARAALENLALQLPCELKDLGCTLISIVIVRDTMVVAHVGDGAVVARDENYFIASPPGNSEYADVVEPITDKDWQTSIRISPVFKNIRDVMALTDGCQRAALKKTRDSYEPFGPFCTPLFEYFSSSAVAQGNDQLIRLLSSKKLCDNSDDDKTLVMITRNALACNEEIF